MLCIYFTSYRVVSLRAAWVTFDAPSWLDRDPYGIHTSSLSIIIIIIIIIITIIIIIIIMAASSEDVEVVALQN